MNYRKLGRTDFKVSEIGLGTEFLFRQPKDVVDSVITEAIEKKINYFDVLFSVEHYLKKLASPLKAYRDHLIITGHLGTSELEERPKRMRSIKGAEEGFLKLLKNLQTDHVDIINIQFVKANEYENIFKPKGLLNLAISFQNDGKARFIGLSTHDISVAMKAINTGKIDVIMFPLNLANHSLPGRDEFLNLCKSKNIGLVAIKPFAAGNLLMNNRTVSIAKYQTGGLRVKAKNRSDINSSICLNYGTSLSGVSIVLMGVKNVDELNENLRYSSLDANELDFSPFINSYQT